VFVSGCVSTGVLQNADVLPPGASAGGIKLAHNAGAPQVLASYRRGVGPSVEMGVDMGLSMLRVDSKVKFIDGTVESALSIPISYNLSLQDVTRGDDTKDWVLTGIAGVHPALIIGVGRLYAAVSGSYYHSRAGWRPAGSRTEVRSPRWQSYGITLGYQSAFGGPDSSRIAAEVSVMHFPGWRTQVMPSVSLQFPLNF
jgi:hypothetical protein